MSSIFKPQPPKERTFANDVVGRFRSGHQLSGQPVSLKEWRITSGDPDVADKVHALLGGDEPQEWAAKGDDNLEVFTKATTVNIIIDPEKGLDAHFYIWPRGAKKLFACSGDAVETDGKRPIECTSGTFTNKKEFLEEEHVCQPTVKLKFRLADDPELGIFEFQSGAWSLITEVSGLLYSMQDYDGPVAATLTLEPVEFESQGTTIRFTKPVIEIKGLAADAYELAA